MLKKLSYFDLSYM